MCFLIETNDPCMKYTPLDNLSRSVDNASGAGIQNCDYHVIAGWYRIMLGVDNARLTTTCPAPAIKYPKVCGTVAPIWFNGKDAIY